VAEGDIRTRNGARNFIRCLFVSRNQRERADNLARSARSWPWPANRAKYLSRIFSFCSADV